MPHYLPFVTSSAIDRFFACAGSVTLPHVRDEDSDAAQAGTVEHADRLRPGMLPQKVLDWFGGVEPAYEVAMAADMALDGSEVRYLGSNIERGYGTYPGPAWVPGTADAVQVMGDVVSVGDLKTGRGQAMGSLPRPDKAGQLLSLAWMAIRLTQERLRTSQAVRSDWQKYHDPLGLMPAWTPSRIRLMWWLTADREDDLVDAEVTYDQLYEWQLGFRQRIHLARAAGPAQLRRGPHCANCPAFDTCPAQGGAVRRVAELSGRGGAAALADADVVAAHLDVQGAEKALDAAKKALRLRVQSRGPVAVDDTHELRLVAGTDTRLDPNVALEVLGERFLDCADVTVSQAGLRRGLGAADVSVIVEEMRKRGGVVTAPKAPYLRVLRKREAE